LRFAHGLLRGASAHAPTAWLAAPLLFVWAQLYRGWEDSKRGLLWGGTLLLIAPVLCAAVPVIAWVADEFANAVRGVPALR